MQKLQATVAEASAANSGSNRRTNPGLDWEVEMDPAVAALSRPARPRHDLLRFGTQQQGPVGDSNAKGIMSFGTEDGPTMSEEHSNAMLSTHDADLHSLVDEEADESVAEAGTVQNSQAKPASSGDSGQAKKGDDFLASLNFEQQCCVADIVHLETLATYPYCVHGPPGTGKTRVVLAAARQIVANGGKVLVVTPSNAAVTPALCFNPELSP